MDKERSIQDQRESEVIGSMICFVFDNLYNRDEYPRPYQIREHDEEQATCFNSARHQQTIDFAAHSPNGLYCLSSGLVGLDLRLQVLAEC